MMLYVQVLQFLSVKHFPISVWLNNFFLFQLPVASPLSVTLSWYKAELNGRCMHGGFDHSLDPRVFFFFFCSALQCNKQH